MALKTKNSDQALIELFLDMLAAERGGAKNTLAAYARDLADFSRELGAAGRTIARASTDDLRSYLVSLGKRGFAAASVARRLSAIRQLYRFLYAEGRRADDPSAVIEGPKRGRGLPKVLSIAEVDRLLAAARSGIDKAEQPKLTRLRAARLACLIEVLYATGLRVSELVALPVSAAESQRAHAHRARQGKQGAPCAAQRCGQGRHARVPRATVRSRRASRKENGSFPRSVKPATSRASILPVS